MGHIGAHPHRVEVIPETAPGAASPGRSVTDVAVARYALRTFNLDARHRVLLPITAPGWSRAAHKVWQAGTCSAHCDEGSLHAAPADDCGCGIHGATDLRSLLLDYPHLAARIIAVIAAEGVTIVGAEGLRTAGGRVVAYWCHPSSELNLAREIFAEQCPDAVSFTDCDAMIAAYGLRMTPLAEAASVEEASPRSVDVAARLGLAGSVVDGFTRLVAVPILLAVLAMIAALTGAMLTRQGDITHVTPTLLTADLFIAVHNLVAAIISSALPGYVFGYSAVVFVLTLVQRLLDIVGCGPRDWTNLSSFVHRGVHHAARSGLRLSIFLLVYSVFAGFPFSAVPVTATLVAAIVYVCTTASFLSWVSHIAAGFSRRAADIVCCLDRSREAATPRIDTPV
jgi:hypothetical protein